jgi:hypothetical protein
MGTGIAITWTVSELHCKCTGIQVLQCNTAQMGSEIRRTMGSKGTGKAFPVQA